jgi:hypothetical protein
MVREERIVLDPEEVAIGRIEVDIHDGAIQVGPDGPDWGDYEVNAFMAKQEMGEVAVDEEIPNRTITIPLVLGATGDFDAARIAISAWAAKVNHQGGGHLKRELIGGSYGEAGSKLFADCVKASLKLGGGTVQARDGIDPDALLTIEALPDFYGEWVEEEAFEGVGDAAETFQILGTLPGRAEITVTEKSGRNQAGLPWHFRREGYSPEAPWAMNVEEWELLGSAGKAALAGSAGSKVVTHSALGTNWTPVAAKTMPHHGAYEVIVRAYTTSPTSPEARLLYDLGDLIDPSENVAVKIPGANGYYLVSLGQVNLEELPIGEHRWRAMLQARGAAGGENISFDRIWFRSILESSGKPSAPRRVTQGIAPPLVFDGFNQSAGNVTGKAPQVGSAYQVASGSASGDYQVDATNHRLTRATTNDGGTITEFLLGRAIGAGTGKLGDFSAAVDFVSLPQITGVYAGLIFRYADAENFAIAFLSNWLALVYKVIGKVPTAINYAALGGASSASGRMELRVVGDEATVTFAGDEALTVKDADLATGGVLEKGRVMLYDQNASATPATRIYDNYEISAPTYDAVNFANRKACLSYRGLYREGPEGGGAYGPMARQLSDLPRVPVSGPEGLPVELAVMTSRSDLDVIADAGRDPLAVGFRYRPCWPSVPAPS